MVDARIPANPPTPALGSVAVRRLSFDPENPRLPSTVDRKDPAAVLEWMLKDGSMIELMGSIGEHGFFPGEPLLTVPGTQVGEQIVVEGNRRLAAVKLLLDPTLAKTKTQAVKLVSEQARFRPEELPVLLYEKREDILDYLGYRHITGVKEWEPLAKARYLKQLEARTRIQDPETRFRSLAKTIGSRADYVARLLTGFAVFERLEQAQFYGIRGLTEGSIDFGVLTTALTFNEIREFLGLDGLDPSLSGVNEKHLEELTTWMFEKVDGGKKSRVGESRNLAVLNRVVANEAALAAFRQGQTLSDAYSVAVQPGDLILQLLTRALSNLQSVKQHSTWVYDITPAAELLRQTEELQQIADLTASLLQEIQQRLKQRSAAD